ncbi:probable ubiquitin-like-specific protease 2A isoform X2 [Mercurialis annua]|nr:probable ubiquitin-like-specific protease 2A isoform X2 [Mercurialis annua]
MDSRNEPIVLDDGPDDVDSEKWTKAECNEIREEVVDVDGNAAGCPDTVSSPMCEPLKDSAVKEMCNWDVPGMSCSSNYENDSRGMVLDDNDESGSSSPSTSNFTLEENEVASTDPEPECCSVGHKIDSSNNTVAVYPDFIQYGDIYCTEPCLTFSTSCISVESSTVNGSKGKINAEWALGDIVSIESEWWGKVDTATVKLHLKSNATSGIDELKFSVYDPYWSKGENAIKLLDVKYRDIWNAILDTDKEKDGKACTGCNNVAIPKPCLHILDETFEEVIYPEGDTDPVTITKRDVELLRPETFINDTIIDFYIKYLRNKIKPEDQHRFHFFNSFFFRKLADLDKDPSSVHEGRAAFQRVRKWTKKLNLFEKDFIFIPVNYSLHWSLIVICHLGEMGYSRDEVSESALKVPCILHMDSIRGSHRGLKNLIQSYLCEEWKARHSEILEDVSSKFSSLRFVPLELPQQENWFDCGLFLLHYVELFLEDGPINISPFKITESSNFLNRNWFIPHEASLKRKHIQKLISEILEDRAKKVPRVECSVEHPCSQLFEKVGMETGMQFLEETCSSVKMYGRNSFSSYTELGLEISPPLVSSQRLVQQEIENSGLDSPEMFNPGSSKKSFSRGNYSLMDARRLSYMSPIEEAEDIVEEILDSSSDSDYYRQNAETKTEYTTKCFGRDFRSSPQSEEMYDDDVSDDDSSWVRSSCESQKSSEIGLDDGFHELGHPKEESRHDELSAPFDDLETLIVDDSQEADHVQNGNDEEFSPMDEIVRKDTVPMINENLMSESGEPDAERVEECTVSL